MASPFSGGHKLKKKGYHQAIEIFDQWVRDLPDLITHAYLEYPYTTKTGRKTKIQEHIYECNGSKIILRRDVYGGWYYIMFSPPTKKSSPAGTDVLKKQIKKPSSKEESGGVE